MKHLFWVIPGKLAGRAGPEVDPWNLEAIRKGGVTAIVSTHEECAAASIQEAGLKHIRKFMPMSYPSNEAQFDHFVSLVRDATEATVAEIASGGCVMVHCYAGRDRTGLVLCAVLMELTGMEWLEAFAEVKAIRPSAMTGPGIVDVLRQYARIYARNQG